MTFILQVTIGIYINIFLKMEYSETSLKKGRNLNLIKKRNIALIHRFYIWTEVRRRRFDDALDILSEKEFFISKQTIENIIKKDYSILKKHINGSVPKNIKIKESDFFK